MPPSSCSNHFVGSSLGSPRREQRPQPFVVLCSFCQRFVCLFVCKRFFLGLSVWFFLTFHKPVACFSPPSIKPVRSTGKHLVSNHCYDKLQTTDPTQKPRSTPQTQTKTADPTQKPSVTNTPSIVMYYGRQIRNSRTLLYILRPRRLLQRLHANSLT